MQKKISRRALLGLLIPATLAQGQPWPPGPPPEAPTLADVDARLTLAETAIMVSRWRHDNAHMRLKILEACYSYCGIIPDYKGKV